MSGKYIVVILKDKFATEDDLSYANIAEFTKDFDVPVGYELEFAFMTDGVVVSHEQINTKSTMIELRGAERG
jgi:hypothetical protein